MRLDIVLGWASGQGGVETVTTTLCQTLAGLGHRIRVFQARPPQYPEWAKTLPDLYYYDPVAAGFPPRYPGESDLFRWALGYRGLLEAMGSPDCIVAAHTPFLPIVARLAVGYGRTAPAVVSWLHGPPNVYGDPSGLWMADGHLAISSEIGRCIREITRERQPVFVVGNPVPRPSTGVARPQHGTEILYMGRLDNDQKNLDLLAEALLALPRAKPSWHATIIGDGPYRQTLADKLAPLIGAGRVSLTGWQADPWAGVKAASLLVLPSNYEGFGMVLVEALWRGIPVLATRAVGPEDIVDPGVNGWLVPVGDRRGFVEILTGIVREMISLPPADVCRRSAEKFEPVGVTARVVRSLETVLAFRARRPL